MGSLIWVSDKSPLVGSARWTMCKTHEFRKIPNRSHKWLEVCGHNGLAVGRCLEERVRSSVAKSAQDVGFVLVLKGPDVYRSPPPLPAVLNRLTYLTASLRYGRQPLEIPRLSADIKGKKETTFRMFP